MVSSISLSLSLYLYICIYIYIYIHTHIHIARQPKRPLSEAAEQQRSQAAGSQPRLAGQASQASSSHRKGG